MLNGRLVQEKLNIHKHKVLASKKNHKEIMTSPFLSVEKCIASPIKKLFGNEWHLDAEEKEKAVGVRLVKEGQ